MVLLAGEEPELEPEPEPELEEVEDLGLFPVLDAPVEGAGGGEEEE